MSFFDRHRIQETLLRRRSSQADECIAVVGTDDDFEDDVLTLRDCSFIKMTKDTNTFEMHSLVQLATRAWLENEGQLDMWRNWFISDLCAELPCPDFEHGPRCEALLPHARVAPSERPKDPRSLGMWEQFLNNAATYIVQHGARTIQAKQMSVASAEVRRGLLGEEHNETLQTMTVVALTKHLAGEYEDAEPMLRRTLALEMKKLQRYSSQNPLENINRATGLLNNLIKPQEGKVMHRQMLARFQKVLGHRHEATLGIMNNLAVVLTKQGKYQEEEVIQRRTLAICKEALGSEHPSTLAGTHNLALLIYKQNLAIRRKVLGYEHPDMLQSVDGLARILLKQGNSKEADALLRQTLKIREKVLGHEHVKTSWSVCRLAVCLTTQNHYDESFSLFKRACTEPRNIFGKDHPTTEECAKGYASALVSYQEYQQGLYDSFKTRPE